MTRTFYNQFRLGDCLWTCHWLRHAALANPGDEFVFYCLESHHWQLLPVLEGTGVKLLPLSQYYGGGVNTWINCDGDYPPADRDLVKYLTYRFSIVAERAGINPVFTRREEWLFDYPALINARPIRADPTQPIFLIVDSVPQSGQFTYDAPAMARLVERIRVNFAVMQTSQNVDNLSVTDWGIGSQLDDYILMISTGPSWPTFNAVTESRIKNRFILLHDKEFINYGREWPHFSTVGACEKHLEQIGLI